MTNPYGKMDDLEALAATLWVLFKVDNPSPSLFHLLPDTEQLFWKSLAGLGILHAGKFNEEVTQ